jgi:hypothetical protein
MVPMAAITNSLRSASAFSCTGGVQFVIEHHLHHAGTVAQVDEDYLAQIAAAVAPSHENNFLTRVGEPKVSATHQTHATGR